MKVIISRMILGSLIAWATYVFLLKIIIQPCIELYAKHGLVGIFAWFVALAIISCIVYVIIKVIIWAINNA